MRNRHSGGVSIGLNLRLVAPAGNTVSVRSELRYAPSDPYAVHITFCSDLDDGDISIAWAFAREVLTEGLYHESGMGDITVWPWETRKKGSVGISLTSPDGHALFEAPRAPIEAFLARSYALVPFGSEWRHIDVDEALRSLTLSE